MARACGAAPGCVEGGAMFAALLLCFSGVQCGDCGVCVAVRFPPLILCYYRLRTLWFYDAVLHGLKGLTSRSECVLNII